MARHKDKEKELARELFIQTDKTQKEIAGMVGVTEKTIGNWVEAGQWEMLRTGRMSTTGEAIANIQATMKARTEQILKEVREGGTNKYGDELLKMSKAIESLKGSTSISTYIGVLSEFMGFIPPSESGFRAKLAEFQSKFLNEKALGI